MKECPFCSLPEQEIRDHSKHAIAILDRYPVSPGHTLIIPRSHVLSIFDLTPDVRDDLWRLVDIVRQQLCRTVDSPEGFNIGVNDGTVAGQTVSHAHIHIIPRYRGDVPDPRGGIRGVVPDHMNYLNG